MRDNEKKGKIGEYIIDERKEIEWILIGNNEIDDKKIEIERRKKEKERWGIGSKKKIIKRKGKWMIEKSENGWIVVWKK